LQHSGLAEDCFLWYKTCEVTCSATKPADLSRFLFASQHTRSKNVKKEPVKNSNKWSVTFVAAPEVEATAVSVVGDFNDWDPSAAPMARRKDGFWAKTVRLEPGSYRYRFVADGEHWLNDPDADGYEDSGHGSENCVVVVG
jgi:1,4-alpha-glucan branching enzyme